MKTTLELPDALVEEVKLRALTHGRKLKDVVADLLRKGLAVVEDDSGDNLAEPVKTTDPTTGFPLIVCKKTAASRESMTPERVAEILLSQEIEWSRDSGR